MEKECPRCGKKFECLHSLSCSCMGVELEEESRRYLAREYPGQCLCTECLHEIAREKPKKM